MNGKMRILCVDDEKNVLRSIERLFLDENYEILTAMTGDEGLKILSETSPVQLVMSDYRMPGMNGVEFLKQVCLRWPDTVRIVLSGYADTGSVVDAINEGEIYKFIPKPWNDHELTVTVANALERYELHMKNIALTEELKRTNSELEEINNTLELRIEERTSDLVFHNQVLVKAQNILDSLPVGVIGIDPDGMIVQYNKECAEIFGAEVICANRKNVFPDQLNDFVDSLDKLSKDSVRIGIGEDMFNVRGRRVIEEKDQSGVILVFDMED